MIGSYGEKRKPLHYIHRQDEPTRLLAVVALFSFHTLSHKTTVDTSLTSRDHVRRGKGWMLSVDAVAVADGKNPLSAHPDQGSLPFSLTKPVRLHSSLAHCRDVGSCRLPLPSSRLSYVPQVQLPLQSACTTAPAAHITPCGYFSTSLPRTYLYWLLCTAHITPIASLCLIN